MKDKIKIVLIVAILCFQFVMISFDNISSSSQTETSNPIFTLFTMGPFDTVLPTTLPSEGNTSGTVRTWGVPGQNVQATFSLHANQDLQNVSVTPNDFVSGSKVISVDYIDVRVVKVWNQSGLDLYMESSVLVPELLVYDDTINLSGGWDLTGDYFPPGHLDNGYYANGDGELSFENPEFFNPIAGTVDFWVKPDWNGTNNSHHRWFIFMNDESDGFFKIYSTDSGIFYAIYDDPVGWEVCQKNDDNLFIKDEWTRITFTWNTTRNFLALYFNGIQIDTNSNPIDPIGRGTMFIGGTDPGLSGDSVIDDMRFYNYSATPSEVASLNFNQNYMTKNITFDSRQDLTNDGGDIHRMIYKSPKIPTEMNTEIPQDTTKQFWFKIRLSEDVIPGLYKTNFTVDTRNAGSVDIPVELEILPFLLDPSPKIHSVYLSMKHNTTYLPYDLLEVYLDDMIDHGINGISVDNWYLSEVNRTFDLLKAKGLKNSVMNGPLANSYLTQRIDRMLDRGFPPYLYGVDEPNNSPEIEQHIRKSYDIHAAGGLVAVAITKETSDKLDDPNSDIYDLEDPNNPGQTFRDQGITNDKLDWANYHATYLEREEIGVDSFLMDYVISLRSGGQKINRVETYYWQPWVQKYKWDRNMAGFFLWGSHLNGSWPWGFSYTPNYYRQRDPFDDFDNQKTPYRDIHIVYPSENGPIPTLQWEAMAEGIIDVRYLATLEYLTKQLEVIDPQRADDIRAWMNITTVPYMTPNQTEAMTGKQFDNTRWAIAMKILELQSELHPPIITDITAENTTIGDPINITITANSDILWTDLTYSIDLKDDGLFEIEEHKDPFYETVYYEVQEVIGRVRVTDISKTTTETTFTYNIITSELIYNNVKMNLTAQGNISSYWTPPTGDPLTNITFNGQEAQFMATIDLLRIENTTGEVLNILLESHAQQTINISLSGLTHGLYALEENGTFVRNLTASMGSLRLELELQQPVQITLLAREPPPPPPPLDLLISEYSLDSATPNHAESTYINVTTQIKNPYSSFNADVVLEINGYESGSNQIEVDRFSSEITTTFSWIAINGDHIINISVKAEFGIFEADLSNNAVSFVVSVPRVEIPLLPPDIWIGSLDIGLGETTVYTERPVRINVTIHGKDIPALIPISIVIRDNAEVIADLNTDAIDGSVWVEYEHIFELEGQHNLTILLTPKDPSIQEADEHNNIASVSIEVKKSQIYPRPPDIWIGSLDIGLGETTVYTERLVRINVTVHGKDIPSNIPLSIIIRDNAEVIADLNADAINGSVWVEYEHIFELEGQHNLTVLLTPKDPSIQEADEHNNIASVSIEVKKSQIYPRPEGSDRNWLYDLIPISIIAAIIIVLLIVDLIIRRKLKKEKTIERIQKETVVPDKS